MLPPILARYPRLPLLVALSWIPVGTFLLTIPAPDGAPVDSTSISNPEASDTSSLSVRSASAVEALTVSVSTSERFSIELLPSGATFPDGPLMGAVVSPEGENSFSLRDTTGTVVATAKRDDDTIRIEDMQSGVKYRAVKDDEEIKIKDETGALLNRIKVKEEKFNVYLSGGQRLFHGKIKNGTLIVRAENDSQVGSFGFSSTPQLPEQLLIGAVFSLPLDLKVRALLITALRTKGGSSAE